MAKDSRRLPLLRAALKRLHIHDTEAVRRALADAERDLPADREAVVIRLLLACLTAQHTQATMQVGGALAVSRRVLTELNQSYGKPDDTQFG